MSAPLDGLLVADFTRVLAGPMATMHLADLGADVVKVEQRGVGDDTRAWGPPWGAGTSTYFESVNRSKRSLTLDLKDHRERALAQELARRADIVVQNFRVGLMEEFGLGYAEVARRNPGVIYCSISGFGSEGGAELPGYDFIVQALGGLMSITGTESSGPVKAGVALVDVLAGKDAVIGVLAALAERARSGLGQLVEVNLLSSLLASLTNQAAAALATGVPPRAMGNAHPSIAPYETVRCLDGDLAIACGNDRQFARLAAAVGEPELAEDERFRTNSLRVAHREALIVELDRVFSSMPCRAWEQRLQEVGVPSGVVNNVVEAFRLADGLGLEPTSVMPGGQTAQIRNPVRYSRSRLRPPLGPPALGQHTDELLRWLRTKENE